MPSYFDKTKSEYWNLEEAIEAEKKGGGVSTESALSSIRSALEFYDNTTAQKWKNSWKKMVSKYMPEPSTKPQPSSSAAVHNMTNNIRNINSAYFDNSSGSSESTRPKKIQRIIKQEDNEHEIEELFNPNPGQQRNTKYLYQQVLPAKIEDIDPEDYDRVVNDTFEVNGTNILEKWIRYQVAAAKQTRDYGVQVETDCHKILALSNILLLKKNQTDEDLENLFGLQLLNDTLKHVKSLFNINNHLLDSNLERRLKIIIKDYEEGHYTSRKAAKTIMELCSDDGDLPDDDVLLGIRNLIERLPTSKFKQDIKERNLCGTYVDAVLRPFLENPSNNKHFAWADIQVVESSSKQPDFVGRSQTNIFWKEPVAFGEVKGEDKKNDLYDNLIDLIRIGQLSKSSIDSNFYNGVVGVHVVGLQVTVYFTTLVAPGLYIMAEICSLAMPRDISCMRGYLSVCEDLLPLHNLYKTACCVVDDIESFKEKIRAGMNTPTFKNLIKTSKNRKRYCPFILNS